MIHDPPTFGLKRNRDICAQCPTLIIGPPPHTHTYTTTPCIIQLCTEPMRACKEAVLVDIDLVRVTPVTKPVLSVLLWVEGRREVSETVSFFISVFERLLVVFVAKKGRKR